MLVSNDRPMEAIASRWLAEGRPFRGLVLWPQEHYKRMTYGDLAARTEALTEPFPHPVMYIKP